MLDFGWRLCALWGIFQNIGSGNEDAPEVTSGEKLFFVPNILMTRKDSIKLVVTRNVGLTVEGNFFNCFDKSVKLRLHLKNWKYTLSFCESSWGKGNRFQTANGCSQSVYVLQNQSHFDEQKRKNPANFPCHIHHSFNLMDSIVHRCKTGQHVTNDIISIQQWLMWFWLVSVWDVTADCVQNKII